jgi:hypothetical protein
MRKMEQKLVERVEEFEVVLCNMCSRRVGRNVPGENVFFYHLTASRHGGERKLFDLCEACFDKIVSQFCHEVPETMGDR